jgi:hypothetical protein
MQGVPFNSSKTGWRPTQIGRKKYIIFAGVLALLTAAFPLSFVVGGGAAGWLLLFTARVHDIGRPALAFPALAVVGVEMFGKDAVPFVSHHWGDTAVGYAALGLMLVHICFAVWLGLQPSSPAEADVR